MKRNHKFYFIISTLFLALFISSAWAGKIVRPWRACSEIVKAGQSFDVWFFHKIKQRTQGRHLWLRNNLSTMTSQTIDTLLYSFVVWWGVVDLPTAIQLGLVKYGFKLGIAAFDTPFIYWARSWERPVR